MAKEQVIFYGAKAAFECAIPDERLLRVLGKHPEMAYG